MKKVPTQVKLLFVMFALAVAALAQGGPTCRVNTDSVPPQCPTSGGWQSGVTCPGPGWLPVVTAVELTNVKL